ncbi:MAG: pseudaminic acid cytidylyltransferase [Oceanicaulis sp.]|nr:pseudaminic acid cytidylyltransferase [Oceanicaulis sp.]
MALAVIPARGGSKRIPRKNAADFCGRPMIAWPIRAALESGCFERLVVSTDDPELAEVARACGAETPFLRPDHLSDDRTPVIDVIGHAIETLEAAGEHHEHVCCLFATAPFLKAEDLRASAGLIAADGVDYVFSAARYGFPIQRAFRVTEAGGCEMFNPGQFHTRSQDLEEAYHDAAQFYWGARSAWLERRPVFTPRARPVVLPPSRVWDIDTPQDWERAELMFRALGLDAP